MLFRSQKTPAGKISNSTLYQDPSGNIRLEQDYNLSIGGNTNSIPNIAKNSMAVGLDNKVAGENVLSVGLGNIASGDNSLALNSFSRTTSNAENSIAAGSHGYTWLKNQFAIGSYRGFDEQNMPIEQTQQSTVTMHLAGTTAHAEWRSLEPVIPIPRNKSIAYDVELLISKAFGTGVAHFQIGRAHV